MAKLYSLLDTKLKYALRLNTVLVTKICYPICVEKVWKYSAT